MKPLANIIDGALPGQAWQHTPRQMAWDRPAQFADLQPALDWIFKRLRNPIMTKKMLNLLQAGAPIDILVQGLLFEGFIQGKFQAPLLMQLVPPVTVMMWRMAESAGVRPMTSQDRQAESGIDFDPTALMADNTFGQGVLSKAQHANEISGGELSAPNMADRQGFIKFRPKARGK
jgi:hypothetical protein